MSKQHNIRELRSLVITILWCSGLGFALLLLPARVTTPARTAFLQASGPVLSAGYPVAGDAAATAGTLRDALLGVENDRMLLKHVEELSNENHMLRESIRRLRLRVREHEALSAGGQPRMAAVSANVIGYDSAPPRRSIAIAAGSRLGLTRGAPVAAGGALVGTLSEVGPYYSRVRLLTDPTTRLRVRCVRTRRLYVLSGHDGTSCRIEPVERGQDVRTGDVLVTAFGPGTPDNLRADGLPVAQIIAVQPDSSRPLFRRVDARPLAGLDRLEHVAVITGVPDSD